jgi:hypothetical protein
MSNSVTMFSGDSRVLTITVTDSAGTAKNITGATINFSLFKSVGGAAILSKTVGNGITITDPTNGVFTVTFETHETEDRDGHFKYEIEVTDSSGNKCTIVQDKFHIKKDQN